MKTLVVAVFGIAFLAVVQGAAQCDKAKFDQATDAFAKELGLSGVPKDIKVYLTTMIKILLTQRLQGQKKICTAFQNLKTSLGDQYDSCLSSAYLKSTGMNQLEASAVVVFVAQQNFICTTGWEVIARNAFCMYNTLMLHPLKIEVCAQNYAAKMIKDLTQKCQYSQEFIDCVTGPFKQACDPSLAATQCQALKIGYGEVFPECSITCPAA